MYMLITGIDVDIEVRSKNKDDKTGSAQKECNKKDGKDGSEEKNTSPMEVDDKQDKEANAARSERGTPESEGWTVVNDTAASHVVNDTTANHVVNDTTASHVVNDTSANQSMNLIFCIFYKSCLE